MLIEWYGHSCFKVSTNGYSIVMDPYNPSMLPRLRRYDLSANLVLASHEHDDHNYRQGVKWIDSDVKNPFSIEYIESFHDNQKGTRRGRNKITILSAEDIRIAHLGDLGTRLTDEQYEEMGQLDAIMIPVGGYYTIDARQAKKICDKLNPTVIIPMHYKGKNFGFKVLAEVKDFIKLYDKNIVIKYDVNTIEITKETPKQVAVLEYK